jgi:hypothetical protein
VNPNEREWFIEEARIQGGYNDTTVDFGPKAYIVEDDNGASIRSNSLIYSGIYNSRTGTNNTNQFSVGEDITKSLNPANGSIQKLYAEDTNLIIFQEDKVSRALIDKDAIYSAEGGGTVTSSLLLLAIFRLMLVIMVLVKTLKVLLFMDIENTLQIDSVMRCLDYLRTE